MPAMDSKTLIVTGSTGIAAATVRLASVEGARVLIATGEEESGFELAAEAGAECWVGELAAPTAGASVVAQCLSKFGRVDALFNAAGLSGRRFGDGPAHECTDEGWETTFARNLNATFYMCRAVVGRMMQQAPGPDGLRDAILNTGSVLAFEPEPRHFATHAYAAAKGAVVAMSRSMAAYYAPHKISVNVISPGLVRTPASERAMDLKLAEFIAKKQPLAGSAVDAMDVARAAIFLLTGGCSITGENLTVDAGWGVSGL
jgi:NAD(P)-dependent dehydrogenase (short-subunit alcohol dehydrogenase family)